MAYANPSTFVAGEVLTAAQQNVLANNDRFFHGPPRVRVKGSAATTCASGSDVAVIFGTEIYDNDAMWSSTAPTIININTPGVYLVGGQIRWEGSTAGTFRLLRVRLNGGTTFLSETLNAPAETGTLSPRQQTMVLTPSLTSTNYLELAANQDSGVALDVQLSAVENTPAFWAIWQSS